MEWIKVPYFDGFSQFVAWPTENYVSIDGVIIFEKSFFFLLNFKAKFLQMHEKHFSLIFRTNFLLKEFQI